MYRYRQHTQKGMMLVEALIAIAIFSLIIIAITVLFSVLWRTQQSSVRLGTASQRASYSVTQIAHKIRNARQADNGAYAIVSIAEDEIIFFGNADSDDDTERIRIFRDGSLIQIGIVNPSETIPVTYDVNTEMISTLVADVVNNPGDTPLFIYYNQDNDVITLPASAAVMRMVEITVSIDVDLHRGPEATTVSTTSSVRNLRQQ